MDKYLRYIRFNTEPKQSPVDLKFHYDASVGWASANRIPVEEARLFALTLLRVCDEVEEIKNAHFTATLQDPD